MKSGKSKLYVTKGSAKAMSTIGKTQLKVAYDKSSETLDLSGTANQYGPPQSVMKALCDAPSQDLRMLAWEAGALVRHAYSNALRVPVDELAAFRGVADFLNAVAQTVSLDRVIVPLPASGDLLRAFPGRQLRGSGPGSLPSLELINEAMAASDLTLITNPNHLVGVQMDSGELLEVALANPNSILVVDETHIEFLHEPSAETLVGAPADNIIVLRSTSDFFGIPASPVAVAWCADAETIAGITGRERSQIRSGHAAARDCRQIGALDALATAAALEAGEWAARSKMVLTYDALWLSQLLYRAPGRVVEHNVGVHFRAFLTRHVKLMSQTLRSHGVQVLELNGSEAEGPMGLRILAPNFEGQPLVEAAVDEIVHKLSDAPHLQGTAEQDDLQSDAGS